VKAVVDNNLLVSGLLWDGLPSRLLEAARDGRVQLAISLSLYEELEDVVHRRKLAERIARRAETPAHVLATVMAMAEVVAPDPLPMPPALRDPDDLAVLECAMAAKAEAVITGDKDLLVLEEYEGIPILTVRTALEKLGISTE
jgi:putative PIN family toxin of toxin-antitoxin system